MNPAASRRRLTSRNGCGLSRPNLSLDRANLRRPRGLRRLEMKLQCFFQVGESLFFGLALAGDIDAQALGHVPVPLAPNRCSEWPFHGFILSHGNRNSTKLDRQLFSCGVMQPSDRPKRPDEPAPTSLAAGAI